MTKTKMKRNQHTSQHSKSFWKKNNVNTDSAFKEVGHTIKLQTKPNIDDSK